MSAWHRLVAVFLTLARRDRLDRDLDDELRAYVELLRDEKIRDGLSEAEATRAALIEAGGVEQVKELVRNGRTGAWLETIWADVRYGARGLRRAPWFTVTAIVSLGLGIGLNTALFSAAEAMLLQALPYREPDRIVRLDQTLSTFGTGPAGIRSDIYEQWKARATSFESVGAFLGWFHDAVIQDGSSAERVDVVRMTSGVFDVLDVPALAGRRLQPEDDRPGARVAVLSYDFWARRWNGDPDVVGRSLTLDGEPYTVVGIMPPAFQFYHHPGIDGRSRSDIYLSDPWVSVAPSSHWMVAFNAIARLKPGATLESAQSEIAAIAASTDYSPIPTALAGAKFGGLVSRWDVLERAVPGRLYLIWGVAALLLLLAAANMANLQLARAGARRTELSIRAALGASRARLARQLITESLMLSLLGGTLGLVLAAWAGPLVQTILPDTSPMWRLHTAGVNWRVMAFMMAIAVIAGLAFGVVPALRSSKADQPTMVPSGRATETKGAVRTRASLMVTQLAVSMVLLAGAGLMLTTFSRVWAIPKGYDTDGLLTFFVRLPRAQPWLTDHGREPSPSDFHVNSLRWAATPRLLAVRKQLAERLVKVPGVQAATVATGVPNVKSMGGAFSLPGRPAAPDQRGRMWALGVEATPGYFEVLGMRLFAGRGLEPADHEGGRLVAVIERRTARAFWPHELQALGDRIEFDGLTYEIVGIANDTRFWMWSDEPGNVIYMPFRADTAPLPFFRLGNTLIQTVAVRVARDDAAVVSAIRQAVADVTGGLPIENVRSMRAAMIDASGNTPGITLLTTASAVVALLLAAVGTFGIVSYTVAQRSREIGIRVALGATRRSIVRLVASSTMRIALAGAGAGVLLSLWLLRFLAGELFPGLSTSDPAILAAVGSLLVAIAVVAACLPARRAADVDPSASLRVD